MPATRKNRRRTKAPRKVMNAPQLAQAQGLPPQNPHKRKTVIFVMTDSPAVNTGFGKVCRENVLRWAATGKYTIVCMGTNDRGEWDEIRRHPDIIIEPLPFINEDPYGMHRMPALLNKYQPDIIWGLNDIWVWTGDERSPNMDHWLLKHIKGHKPYVPLITYFPVDGNMWDQKWVQVVNASDFACPFTDYGQHILSHTNNVDMNRVRPVYHGHDHENFFPVPEEHWKHQRRQMGVPEDAFMITMIGRNQPRKQIPMLMYAFHMFWKGYVSCNGTNEWGERCGFPRNLEVMPECELCGSTDYQHEWDGVPNAYLYLHMNALDMRGYRIPKIQRDLRLDHLIMPKDHDVAKGIPIQELNLICNASDILVNPASAGGYELTVAEGMATGRPVVATRSTSMVEQLEDERGYLVRPSNFIIFDDAAHTPKHLIDMRDLVRTFVHIYQNPEEAKARGQKAIEFAKSRSWDRCAQSFMDMFDEVLKRREPLHERLHKEKANLVVVNETTNAGEAISMIPALSGLAKKNPQVKILLAVPERLVPLFAKLKSVEVINLEKMWLDRTILPQMKVNIQNVTGQVYNIENAALMLGREDVPSYLDSYGKLFDVPIDFKQLPLVYTITDDEKAFAQKALGEFANNGNRKILFLADATSPKYGVDTKTWTAALNLMKKFKGVDRIVMLNHYDGDNVENADLVLGNMSFREIMAVACECDLIVTNIEELAPLCNFLELNTVFIEGQQPVLHNAKYFRSRNPITQDPMLWVARPMQKQAGNGIKIGSSDIFAQVHKAYRTFLKIEQAQQEEQPEPVEVE